jgi:hypothetical protein
MAITYPIKIYWKNGDNISAWDEKCIELLEKFGLPGHRYVTSFSENYLEIIFYKHEDAVLATLIL